MSFATAVRDAQRASGYTHADFNDLLGLDGAAADDEYVRIARELDELLAARIQQPFFRYISGRTGWHLMGFACGPLVVSIRPCQGMHSENAVTIRATYPIHYHITMYGPPTRAEDVVTAYTAWLPPLGVSLAVVAEDLRVDTLPDLVALVDQYLPGAETTAMALSSSSSSCTVS